MKESAYVSNVRATLGASSRSEAVAMAAQRGVSLRQRDPDDFSRPHRERPGQRALPALAV